MPRAFVNPPELHPTPGFSHVAISQGDTLVTFAGQTALDRDFGLIGPDDLKAQTRAAMENLSVAMAAAGVSWDDIVKRTIFTLYPEEFAAIAEVIDEVTGGAANPPQTIVGVTGLALPGLLIEIEAVAVLHGAAPKPGEL
ncbi:RidA family protein [Pseudooceanicola sp. GBMRC 2024]|uniref:RidA family protein n=1 Tax=Pseudooceanicola albus TaxID=2692189 RepID=A0A6L7G170_9RHOB|nr:RidA family protein [Pseudooceanicola albus]MXN17805.1 RidA family protein [Pseudooceanicola albus]